MPIGSCHCILAALAKFFLQCWWSGYWESAFLRICINSRTSHGTYSPPFNRMAPGQVQKPWSCSMLLYTRSHASDADKYWLSALWSLTFRQVAWWCHLSTACLKCQLLGDFPREGRHRGRLPGGRISHGPFICRSWYVLFYYFSSWLWSWLLDSDLVAHFGFVS